MYYWAKPSFLSSYTSATSFVAAYTKSQYNLCSVKFSLQNLCIDWTKYNKSNRNICSNRNNKIKVEDDFIEHEIIRDHSSLIKYLFV